MLTSKEEDMRELGLKMLSNLDEYSSLNYIQEYQLCNAMEQNKQRVKLIALKWAKDMMYDDTRSKG